MNQLRYSARCRTATIGMLAISLVAVTLAAPHATEAAATPSGGAARLHLTHGAPAGKHVTPSTKLTTRRSSTTSTPRTRSAGAMSTARPQSLSGPGAIGALFAYAPVGAVGVPLSSDTASFAITPSGAGAWELQVDGSIKPSGDAAFFGDAVGQNGCGNYSAIASTGTGAGYWVVTDVGCVLIGGDATFYGDASTTPSGTIVAMRPTPDFKGYYLVDEFGAVFPYGDAVFHGDTHNIALNRPITSMAVTSDNGGYWLVASDGGIFTFGDAPFHGSTGNIVTAGPVLDLAATSTNGGYWLVSAAGTVYPFGDAASFGDLSSNPALTAAIQPTADDKGYWLAGFDGSLHQFGDATALSGDTAYVMGSFFVSQATSTAGDFAAVIDWGDGTSSAGQIDGVGNYVVTGRHTYPRAGYWRATVRVTDTAGDDVRASATGFSLPTEGYWMVASDGGIFTFGQVPFLGSMGAVRLNQPVVGMAATPRHLGYWMVASDGGIFSFGDAQFHGSTGNLRLNKPVVGMAATPDGGGYWLVASDGGVFSFGDAVFHGSTGNIRLNQPIVGMAATPDGGGYWLVAADGGIFTFGDAGFHGSGVHAGFTSPVVGMADTPDGGGYWIASQNAVLPFGDAPDYSSALVNGQRLNAPMVGIGVRQFGEGFYLDASDGGIFSFGDAPFLGSMGAVRLNKPVVGMAAV